MSIACQFEYVRPARLSDALRWLARPVEGGAVSLAGGTDLVAWLRDGAVSPGRLVDLKDLEELRGIEKRAGRLWIGANMTFSEILDSPLIRREAPILWEAAGLVASVGIRNRATLGGNICSAVPCCDSGPALLVYEAVVHVATRAGRRRIPIRHWFVGPRRTALGQGGIVLGISLPLARHAGAFAKLKRYRGEDLAQASVAVWSDGRGAWRVAYGAVAPTPLRGPRVERILRGHPRPSAALRQQAAAAAEAEVVPITDIRSSERYRRLMIGVMLPRVLAVTVARHSGRGPEYGVNVVEEDSP